MDGWMDGASFWAGGLGLGTWGLGFLLGGCRASSVEASRCCYYERRKMLLMLLLPPPLPGGKDKWSGIRD